MTIDSFVFTSPSRSIRFPLTSVAGFLGSNLRESIMNSINPLRHPIRLKKTISKACIVTDSVNPSLREKFLISICS